MKYTKPDITKITNELVKNEKYRDYVFRMMNKNDDVIMSLECWKQHMDKKFPKILKPKKHI